jgi:hypothetical protein
MSFFVGSQEFQHAFLALLAFGLFLLPFSIHFPPAGGGNFLAHLASSPQQPLPQIGRPSSPLLLLPAAASFATLKEER